jgi:hypothetical protein
MPDDWYEEGSVEDKVEWAIRKNSNQSRVKKKEMLLFYNRDSYVQK